MRPARKDANNPAFGFLVSERKPVRSAKFSWQNVKLIQALKKAKHKQPTVTNFKTQFLLKKMAIVKVEHSSLIKKFYLAKGCRYLQLQEYGLFYVGPGACPHGIPSFESHTCNLRLKYHS